MVERTGFLFLESYSFVCLSFYFMFTLKFLSFSEAKSGFHFTNYIELNPMELNLYSNLISEVTKSNSGDHSKEQTYLT